jgi:uncharacterized membrane protein YqjE
MIRRILAALVGTLRIRLELAGIELQEEIGRLATSMALALAGAMLLCIGGAFAAIAIVVAVWETHRVLALAGFAVLFCGGGGGLLWLLVRNFRDRPTMFAETLGQLELDHQRLVGEVARHTEPPEERGL